VAASGEWRDPAGTRQPGGEVHGWRPGQNQTVCGLSLSRAALRRFPHLRFDYASTDVLTERDEVRWICPRCVAATGGRRNRRPWTRVSPRP
jgi:hypothetical protein